MCPEGRNLITCVVQGLRVIHYQWEKQVEWWGCIFNLPKELWTPESSLHLPSQLVLPRTSASPFRDRRARGWGRVQGRAGPARMWLRCRELSCSGPCSLSPRPVTPKLAPLASLQPCLAQSNPSRAPPPSLLCPQRRAPGCPLPGTEDKNTQWKNTWPQVKH